MPKIFSAPEQEGRRENWKESNIQKMIVSSDIETTLAFSLKQVEEPGLRNHIVRAKEIHVILAVLWQMAHGRLDSLMSCFVSISSVYFKYCQSVLTL